MTDDPLLAAVQAATDDDGPTIRETLAKIEVLDLPSARPLAPRLLLTKIAFDGRKPAGLGGADFHYERDLTTGVQLWKAPNLRGKSTVLRTIRWALTGGVANDARATQDWITATQLDFTLGGTAHRIRFTHAPARLHEGAIERRDDDSWSALCTFGSQQQHMEAARDFFAAAFGLDRLSWTQHKANSLETTEGHATWGTYFNGLFLDEQTYGQLVAAPALPGGVNQKVIAALLGLPDLVRINRLQQALDGLRVRGDVAKVVRASHGGSEASLARAKRVMEEELVELRARLDAQPKQTDLQAALKVSDAARAAFVTAIGKVADLSEEAAARAAAVSNAEARCRMLKDSVEFRLFFNGIEVTHCPRCERAVGEAEKQREAAEHACRVCGRDVPTEGDDGVASLRDELEQAERDRSADQEESAKSTRARDAAERAQERAREAVDATAAALDAVTVGAAPLLERRDELNVEIGKLQGRLEGMRAATDEELERLRVIYQAALAHLLARQEQDGAETLDAFRTTATHLARQFGLADVEHITFDRDRALKIVQAGEDRTFGHFSGGGQQRLKIAVLLAIALLGASRPESRHPRLLFIDAPAGHEMVKSDEVAIAAALRDLEERHGAEIQVLLASAHDPLVEATVPEKRAVTKGYLF